MGRRGQKIDDATFNYQSARFLRGHVVKGILKIAIFEKMEIKKAENLSLLSQTGVAGWLGGLLAGWLGGWVAGWLGG